MNPETKHKLYKAIKGSHRTCDTVASAHAQKLADYLISVYGFSNVTFIAGRVYNIFMLATDSQNRTLFIKSGVRPELYRNEYIMGKQLWDIDNEHFLKPLHYNDQGEENLFFANEYMPNGITLQRLADSGRLKTMPADTKMSLVRDLHQIFIAMKQSDVVHRDIRPENFIVSDGRLLLIDFQFAVSKSNYQEFEFLSVWRLRGLGDSKYHYKRWKWDDAYSLLQCLHFIGCPAPEYRPEYRQIQDDIKSYIGHDVITSSKRESGLGRLKRHLKKHRRKK